MCILLNECCLRRQSRRHFFFSFFFFDFCLNTRETVYRSRRHLQSALWCMLLNLWVLSVRFVLFNNMLGYGSTPKWNSSLFSSDCMHHTLYLWGLCGGESLPNWRTHTHTTKYLIVSNAGNRHLFVSGYHWNTMCSMHEVLLFGLNLRFGWRKCTFRFRLTAPHKSNKTVVSPAKSIPQLETHANTKSQEFINQTHQSPEPQNKYYIFCFVQTSQ